MKTAVFFVLDEYADWEAAYLSSILSKEETWRTVTASNKKEVRSIGGFKTLVDYTLKDMPKNLNYLF